MKLQSLYFNSLEELQHYFGTKDIICMNVRETVETKYAAKNILAALQENGAPALVTNFWYVLLQLTEERLKTLGYKIIDTCFDDFANVVHIIPEDLLLTHPHVVARQMFEDISDNQLREFLDQALDERPLNKELLNMLRIEYARRYKLN